MSMSGSKPSQQWRPPSVARQTPRMLGNGEVSQPTGHSKPASGLEATASLTGKSVGGGGAGAGPRKSKSGDLAAAAAALAGAASKLAATVDPGAAAAAAKGASSLVIGVKGDVTSRSKPSTGVARPKFKPIPEDFMLPIAEDAPAPVAPRPPSTTGVNIGGMNVVRPPTAMKDGSAVPASEGQPRKSTSGGAEILSIPEGAEYKMPSRPRTGASRGGYGPGPGTPGFEAAVRAALQTGGSLSSRPDTADLSIEDRFKKIYEIPGRHSRITPSSKAADIANRYNEAVRLLKDKINSKGSFAITQHFQGLDKDQSGTLEMGEFKNALELFNLGECVTDEVADMLLKAVDKDGSGSIDYEEFTQALRMGRVPYLKEDPGIRRRVGPDPELPFGDPGEVAQGPYAIMHDADTNLEAFDKKVNNLYMRLEDSFNLFDKDGSGEVDKAEFLEAMDELNTRLNLKLSKDEINALFKAADTDGGGSISYAEFMRGFGGAGQRRFIPEFLKPKIARRSAQGNPWDWTAENPNDKFIQKVGSSNQYFAQDQYVKLGEWGDNKPPRPNRKNWHPDGGKPMSVEKMTAPDPSTYTAT